MTQRLSIEQYQALSDSERRGGAAQAELPGIKHVSHSNRGKIFEDMLERTHHYYSVQKFAFVQKNPVEWRYVSKSQYDTFRNSSADIVAKTNRGCYLKKFKSNVDFSGVIAPSGRAVTFDAKQIKGKSLPLGNIANHQIRTLCQTEAAGGIAGIMIYFTDIERIFFVSASVVERCQIEMLYKGGKKSISLGDCKREGVEILIDGNLADWLKAIK